MPHLQGNKPDTGLLLWTEQLLATPGTHTLVIEAQDQIQSSIGAFSGTLNVSDFTSDTLQLSTPLLAHRIQTHQTRPYGRNQFTILANPSGQFDTHANIATYFETYNLTPNEAGFSHMQVRYSVKSAKSGYQESPDTWETIAEKTIQHQGNWATHAHEFRGNWLIPGPKIMRIQVEDIHSGQIAQVQTPFRVAW